MSCPHGFPNPKNCFECMEESPLPQEPWKKEGFPFPFYAMFTSECKSCGDKILQGVSLIQRWDKPEETLFIHYECEPK